MSRPSVESLFGPTAEAEASNGSPLADLAKRLLILRGKADAAKMLYDDAKEQAEQTEANLLLAMEQAKLKSVKLESGELLTACVKSQFSMPNKDKPEDRHAVIVWLNRIGMGNLAEESVHAATLTKICRERQADGKEINPLVKEFQQQYLSVRKG